MYETPDRATNRETAKKAPGSAKIQRSPAMTHRLSIIIPTYNRPSILPRAVASALAACPEGSEIIVVDDQSDTAQDALQSVVDDPRLKIVTNKGDKGAAGARNFGVGIARGQVILFLDDDDEMIADYPARVLAASDQGGADFGFSAVLLVNHGADTADNVTLKSWKALQHGVIPANVHLQHKMPGLCYGVWVRKAVFQDVGGLCMEQTVDEDGDLFCRLHGLGHACWFDSAPGFRVHRAYETGSQIAPQLTRSTDPTLETNCRIRTYQKNHEYFPLRSADRWYLIRRVLRYAAYKGVDNVAIDFLQDIRPVDWRLQAWLFWKAKKVSARRNRKYRKRP